MIGTRLSIRIGTGVTIIGWIGWFVVVHDYVTVSSEELVMGQVSDYPVRCDCGRAYTLVGSLLCARCVADRIGRRNGS